MEGDSSYLPFQVLVLLPSSASWKLFGLIRCTAACLFRQGPPRPDKSEPVHGMPPRLVGIHYRCEIYKEKYGIILYCAQGPDRKHSIVGLATLHRQVTQQRENAVIRCPQHLKPRHTAENLGLVHSWMLTGLLRRRPRSPSSLRRKRRRRRRWTRKSTLDKSH